MNDIRVVQFLKDVSFELKAGQCIAIVGHSGSGKSTTVNLIPRLYDVTEGAVYFDGIDVRQMDLAQLRGNIGVVTQETYLFNGTIRENLLYVKPEASEEEMIMACKKANIHDFIMNLEYTKDELNTEAPITQELFLKSFYINEATNQNKIGKSLYYKEYNSESYTEEKSYRNLLFSPHVNLNHTMSFCDNKDMLQVGLSYRFRNKDCTLVYYSRLNK